MTNHFESPFKGKLLSDDVTNRNIKVGRYSYYSGYYHGHSFDDCARYLMPDRDDVDQLIIGSFCSIGSGAAFIMAGNQGHRYDWASSFPFFYMSEVPAFAQSRDAFQKAGDTVIGNDVWIGSEAMIMPGITIGHGAVIGSRASSGTWSPTRSWAATPPSRSRNALPTTTSPCCWKCSGGTGPKTGWPAPCHCCARAISRACTAIGATAS